MAGKTLFSEDYEIHASAKMLYPYISTASGLSEWFADDVTINPEKIYTFVWDNERHKAIVASHRTNHFTRFEFLPENEEDKDDPSYFELRIELNELTQTTFLKVSDYSDIDDLTELKDLWDSLIEDLRKVVGG
ncbi:MAG: START-like domain-containing protein [Cyclobacteriaceae bacterium]|nr:START-like domain-containing protein [Cyclobacteriaceae bacterium]